MLVDSLGDSSVNLNVRFWIKPPKRREAVETQDQVLEQLKSVLIAAGIDLPMPTQQILFHDQTETVDGDRTKQREGWPARKDNPRTRQQIELEDRPGERAPEIQSPTLQKDAPSSGDAPA